MKLPQGGLTRILLVLAIVLMLLLVGDMALVRARRHVPVGYDTTRATGPIGADGKIDYVAAVDAEFSRGVTDENNAAPLLVQAFGPIALPSTLKIETAQRLHIPVPPDKGDYMLAFDDFESAMPVGADHPELDFNSWPMGNAAQVGKWVKANEKPLQLIRQAAERSRFYMPMRVGSAEQTLIGQSMPHLNAMRHAAELLAADAQLRAGAGDIKSAYADVWTMHRLARLLSESPTVIDVLVAGGIETMAFRTDRNIAQHAGIAGAAEELIQVDKASTGDLPIPHAIDVGDRYTVLEFSLRVAMRGFAATGKLYGNGPSNGVDPPMEALLPIPHADVMRWENTCIDSVVDAIGKATYAERQKALKAATKAYETPPPWLIKESGAYLLVNIIVADASSAHLNKSMTRSATECRLTKIVRALTAYHQEKGEYPTSLEQLKPRYLAEVPNDAFTEAAFPYMQIGTGYRLYSTGPNMTDEQGSDAPPADDIDASLK